MLVWIAPSALALVGLVVLASVARRATEEAAGLRRDLGRFAEMRPVLAEVRADWAALRDRPRRPVR